MRVHMMNRNVLERPAPLRRLIIRAESQSSSWRDSYAPLKSHSITIPAGKGKTITLQTGEIGRQASGAVLAIMGETHLYTTACCSPSSSGDGSFVPLTVSYAEKFSAAGRTSSGYIKREGRPKDNETLISRLVDRPIRPMFDKGWANETQILQWVMSYDGLNCPEPLAITAAGAALLISDIPFSKAVAGVRVGYIATEDRFVINPNIQEQERSCLDLLLAGTKDSILMIEGFCDLLTEEQMLKAVAVGHECVSAMCAAMEGWASTIGKPKILKKKLVLLPEGLEEAVEKSIGEDLKSAYMKCKTKEERSAAEGVAEGKAKSHLLSSPSTPSDLQVSLAVKNVKSAAMRSVVLEHGRRMDGRSLTDIRPITSRAQLLPRTHGSVLFTRGETQAICVATLGSKSDALKSESIREEGNGGEEGLGSRFYLQYFFPPSSVGEVGKQGGPGRRELGHGNLAERALSPVIPKASDFPYVIRVESTVTESNGSSSMASVCGGCLSMLDAGVPLTRNVAGIAMGLILEPDGRFSILSDILGTEDSLGDMDFKVAGDEKLITAFQMDIKVEGITLDIMKKALAQAGDGRRLILGEMAKCNPPPQRALSKYSPKIVRLKIDPSKKGSLIGAGGKTINTIKAETKATAIDIDEEGNVQVTAGVDSNIELAVEFITLVTQDPPLGKIFRARKVSSIMAFGVFVELGPGREGLIHISQLDTIPLTEIGERFKVGDKVDVQVLDTANGKISLSRKAVLMIDSGEEADLVQVSSTTPRAPLSGSFSSSLGSGGGRGAGRGAGRGGRGTRL